MCKEVIEAGRMEDTNYNLSLHREVLRLFGVKMDIREMLDDYQQIYDKDVLGDREQRWKR